MRHLVLILSLFLSGILCAQEIDSNELKLAETEIVDFPDRPMEFPGGHGAMVGFIRDNLNYPEQSRKNGDHGKVFLKFIVEQDGMISNIELIAGGLTPELNAEAIRVVESMPPWIPAEDNGEPVRARCRLSIMFSYD